MTRSIFIPLAAAGALAACSAGAQPYPETVAYAPVNAPPADVPQAQSTSVYAAPVPSPSPPIEAVEVADPPPLRVARPGYATCRILTERTRNGVAFTAVGEFDRAVSGDYSFTITKRGRSGSSDIVQDGPFRARAGETRALGNAEISIERRGGYRAVLKVYANGRQICRREIGS